MRSPPTLRRVSRHFWKNGVRVGRESRAPPCACRTNCPESGTENNNEKNATPTASEATAVGHRSPCPTAGTLPDCPPSAIRPPVAPASSPLIEFWRATREYDYSLH